ncbi:hypothetical protein DdX_21696 [Ditylenchus destructor]|uniref:Uncharacterized protein n=1 Tax=Ditylenchus destructor TaxID=166010 RepID=A0AAD4MIM2_9BILA|nr:hypothetical protein DdX_21696 [Ditylenchus destructor]
MPLPRTPSRAVAREVLRYELGVRAGGRRPQSGSRRSSICTGRLTLLPVKHGLRCALAEPRFEGGSGLRCKRYLQSSPAQTSAPARSEASSMARLTPTPSGGMTCAASPSSVRPSRRGQASGADRAEIGRMAAMPSHSEISARIDGAQPGNFARKLVLRDACERHVRTDGVFGFGTERRVYANVGVAVALRHDPDAPMEREHASMANQGESAGCARSTSLSHNSTKVMPV